MRFDNESTVVLFYLSNQLNIVVVYVCGLIGQEVLSNDEYIQYNEFHF